MKILILTNHQLGLYKFRRELLEEMVLKKYKVYISVPGDEFTEELKDINVKVIPDRYMDRRGTNLIHDFKLLNYYRKLLKKIEPDVVLTYTIKSNVYGGFLCGKMRVPYIANVTGLGTSIQNGGVLQSITLTLYRIGLRKAQKIFFQNKENYRYMLEHRVVKSDKTDILPGSGVNTKEHGYEPYPENDDRIVFSTIGRIMKDKGMEEVLGAAEEIKKHHSEIEFRLIGDFDEEYEVRVRDMEKRGIVKYKGFQKKIHPFIAESHAIIHASYHEGMSNVLQEAASTGRPVIATDVHGCIEAFEPGVTGIAFKAHSKRSLIEAIENFLNLTHEQKVLMGKAGREKMEKEFSREIVVKKYMAEIRKLEKRKQK